MIKRNKFPYKDNDSIFIEYPYSHIHKYEMWKDLWPDQLEVCNKEEINSLLFRSDEFSNVHNGKHILFSGCSNTWGYSLKKEEMWAKKTYNLISKDTECSGYFNLSVPGASTVGIVFNLFRYFRTYGNPDILFVNLPDFKRYYFYDKEKDLFYDSFYNEHKFLDVLCYQEYLKLDQYCKSNNIKLFCFSWDIGANNKDYMKNFKTFYTINFKNMNNFIYEYGELNKDDKFVFFARDNEHFGTGFNDYWSKFIYKKYKNSL